MATFLGSIAKLLGRSSISDEDVLQVLRNHEQRMIELEKIVTDLESKLDNAVESIEKKFKETSKKSQQAKKQATGDLKRLQSELETLIGAMEIVINGELAQVRKKEIKDLINLAKGHRTRINNVIESRVQ